MKRLGALALLCLAVVVVGFLYDIYFAGIPYQDPTPDLQARWNFHKSVSSAIMLASAIGLAIAAATTLWGFIQSRRKR